MTNQKLIRSTLLAAAMTVSAANASTAFGVQQGQYQPGQPGEQIPQGNTAVTRELNRMFQESGQEMPSMNPQELPNANAPTQGEIRPIHPQNQLQFGPHANSNQLQPPAGTKTPGRLSRFFQKLRGNSDGNTSPDNLNYRPPVPPGYQNAASSTASAGARNGQSQDQGSLPQQSQPATNVPRPATAQVSHGSKPSANQAAHSSPQDSAQFTNGAMSRIPPRSGATVRPSGTTHPVSTSPGTIGNRTTYTQPGSAPGFMSTAGVSTVIQKQPAQAPPLKDKFQDEFIRENTGGSLGQRTVRQETVTTADSVAAKDAVSGFENPFLDTRDSIEATELLDLDSLIEIPRAAPETVLADVPKTRPAAPVPAAPVELETPPAPKTAAVRELQQSTSSEANALADDADQTINENPFTGVQLETSDASLAAGQERVSGVESDIFGTPVTPMEDFNPDLPAIALPPVGVEDSTEVEVTGQVPAPELSETGIEAAAAASAEDSVRAELQPSADVPSAMSAADTERLRQTAEQERRQRRQRQQRQILVRAGQTGFKGFCPVVLRERRELVECNPQFTSTFGLQTYTFSSAESKIAFDTDPSRYTPAAGGSDVVVLVNSGEEQAGQLDYALWYRDRLYLFRSRETMTLFSKDPQRFASQY